MAAPKRNPDTSLEKRLFSEFYRFTFFKAVNLLERLSPDKKPLGQTLNPGLEAVRFSVRPGFAFPPSDIADLTQSDEGGPVDMSIAFMGLIGPSGVLPYWYNELAGQRVQEKDFALTAFFDIFHHRLISLFYLAWKKYQFPANYQPGAKDRLSRYLLSLMGLGSERLADAMGMPGEELIFHSGLLSRQIPSAVAIEAMIGSFAGTPVSIQQFIDRIVAIEVEDQTRIGLANARLGVDAVCGCQAWENQTCFRVNLGPMGYRHFTRFLPTGDMLTSAHSLVKKMVGMEYEFDIGIRLKRDEVPACVLGKESPAPPRLGWSTWIHSGGFLYQDDPHALFRETDLQPKSMRKGDVQWSRPMSSH